VSRFSFLGHRRTTIIVLVLASITLLTFDLRGSSAIDGARRTALDVFAPVREAGSGLFRPVGNAWRGIVDYDDLKRENDELRDRVEVQEGASIAAEAQVREYQELLAASELPTVANIPSVVAQVVALPPSNFELTVEINQGARVGIRVGMPVVTPAGLVGRITQVGETRSVVRLVTDPELNVAVKIVGASSTLPTMLEPPPSTTLPPETTVPAETTTVPASPDPGTTTPPTTVPAPTVPPPASLPPPPTTTLPPTTLPAITIPGETVPGATTTTVGPPLVRELGILHGQGKGKPLTVDFVDSETPVNVGDPVVTSGVDQSLSPADIPVGRVSSVRRATGSFQLDVKVEPAVDLDNLNFVKVLLYVPEL
jgi:cell shape-determining protein MreC